MALPADGSLCGSPARWARTVAAGFAAVRSARFSRGRRVSLAARCCGGVRSRRVEARRPVSVPGVPRRGLSAASLSGCRGASSVLSGPVGPAAGAPGDRDRVDGVRSRPGWVCACRNAGSARCSELGWSGCAGMGAGMGRGESDRGTRRVVAWVPAPTRRRPPRPIWAPPVSGSPRRDAAGHRRGVMGSVNRAGFCGGSGLPRVSRVNSLGGRCRCCRARGERSKGWQRNPRSLIATGVSCRRGARRSANPRPRWQLAVSEAIVGSSTRTSGRGLRAAWVSAWEQSLDRSNRHALTWVFAVRPGPLTSTRGNRTDLVVPMRCYNGPEHRAYGRD